MSLKVWLPLDGDLRNLGVSDIEVTNNGATVNNAGKIGKCYNFTNSNIIIPSTNFKNNFTNNQASLALWVKVSTNHSSYTQVLVLGTQGTSWNNILFGIDLNSGGTPIANASTGSAYTNLSFNTTIKDGIWHHLAYTYNNGVMTVYLDGIQKNMTTTTNIPAWANSTNLYIGGNSGGEKFTNGDSVNDVRVYNHCLSAAEVHEIAQGLVLHYKLDASSEEIITKIPSTNVYNYPTFNTASVNGGWEHWGPSGHSGNYGQNTNKKYIYNKNNAYSHWIMEDAGTGSYYLLYQRPSFEGGHRSIQAIIKEENSLPITESICYPTWNARNGGVPNNKWTSIESLGDGFYYCRAEGVSQDGSNDLIGIDVLPGYKIYVSECYVENDTETCSPIFSYSSNIIQDSSGYNHNGTINGALTTSSDTTKYTTSTIFNGSSYVTIPKIFEDNVLLSEFTWVGWVKRTYTDTNEHAVYNGITHIRFQSYNNRDFLPFISWYHSTDNNSALNTWTTGSSLPENTWAHIAFTFKDGVLKYYYNGIYTGISNRSSTGQYIKTNYGATFGSYGTSNYWIGNLSDVRVYTTQLLDTDIKLLYNTSSRIDNLGGVYSFELNENQSNIFRSELIMPVAKAGYTTRIGEIVEHNGYYAMNIAPAPFYKNISDSVSGILQGYFYTNTSYIFDLWIDVDSVIYNGENVPGGLRIVFTDGSSDSSFVFTGGNKGWQHKKIITPSNKSIDRLEIYYYTTTDVFYRLDSYICPISSTKIIKQGILNTANITENSEIASIYKGGSIYSSKFIEM